MFEYQRKWTSDILTSKCLSINYVISDSIQVDLPDYSGGIHDVSEIVSFKVNEERLDKGSDYIFFSFILHIPNLICLSGFNML